MDSFTQCVETELEPSQVPLAAQVISSIPVYDANAVRKQLGNDASIKQYMQEWGNNFQHGSGIMVIRGCYQDLELIDQVTDVLTDLIAEEEAGSNAKGDHFAPAGSNSRLWNAHEKLGIRAPELYLKYNANPLVSLVSQSWLGPMYQMTAQVNLVRPGGQAQNCHRDYHLGFVSRDHLFSFPTVVHALSAALTLQAAIAHCDMPVASGPTKLLPFSQRYVPGYIAATLPAFSDYFEQHYVQLPLNKGDMLFFNPATFHAAGENKTDDIHRFANLLQIGSGFGRSIETVDTARICRAIYPALMDACTRNKFSTAELDSIVASSAEGYAFPTNLDLDQPTHSMIPMSEQDLLRQAIAEQWSADQFSQSLEEQAGRRVSFRLSS